MSDANAQTGDPSSPRPIATAVSGRVRSLLRGQPEPILLIGAGASITSGVPTAGETVERIARWRWCLDNDVHPDDPAVRRADYWPWLSSQNWFDPNVSLAQLYPICVERLLNVASDRRAFFEELINPPISPNRGYQALANILQNGWISTVLTTNFDACLQKASVLVGRPHHLVSIKTASDFIQFSSAPENPQLVYLHGSIEHYSDKNLEEEVQTLDAHVVNQIQPLLRDHPIIVVGYRGGEPSIMNGLFLEQLKYTNNFARGVYWCYLDREGGDALAPLVEKLASTIGGNFSRVAISGFDDFLDNELWSPLASTEAPPRQRARAYRELGQPHDMRVLEEAEIEDLDRVLLFTRLKDYASVTSMWAPDQFVEPWTIETANTFNVVADIGSNTVPTFAGWVLFAKNPLLRAPNATVHVIVEGPVSWLKECFGDDAIDGENHEDDATKIEINITGTLWSQLDQLSDTLSLVNQQFRLKEEVSRQVRAYSPLALKEVVVNALVHRDYEISEPVQVDVTPTSIVIRSPGGLIPSVVQQLGDDELGQSIRAGTASIKGYRNPVIADLFYGGGLMDHVGSGLADIWRQTVNNNGDVEFGPEQDNSQFVVRLYPRTEAVDRLTNTGVAVEEADVNRFSTNLLPITELPTTIWHTGTSAYDMRSLRRLADGLALPPGYVHGGRFYSFYDLEQLTESLVSPFDAGDVEPISTEELLEIEHGEVVVTRLLKEAFYSHLKSIGLYIDYSKDRAHYTRTDESEERKITYQGRVKKATRTVVKARTKRDSDDVAYYEHKALNFSVMSFGTEWSYVLSPGYSFTRNGYGKWIGRDMTNSLSTRRAAKDYNPAVHHDVTFWLAMLSKGTTGVFALEATGQREVEPFSPTILLVGRAPTISYRDNAFGDGIEEDTLVDADLVELEDEISALAQMEEAATDSNPPGDSDVH